MKLTRSSGILLHPTSLPGRFGIGDLGPAAYEFVDFLAGAKQRLWQVLPLGPTGYGDSPYQCLTAFGGNPLLISPEKLVEEGWLEKTDIKRVPEFDPKNIDYGWVVHYKLPLLAKAHVNFVASAKKKAKTDFADFCSKHARWLDDFALFMACKKAHGGAVWTEWDRGLVDRKRSALTKWREQLAVDIETQKFWQYQFYKQWSELRAYCQDRNIQIVGDIPIYVAHDCSDVWRQRDLFCLDENGNPTQVAGVPPDYFSATGQLWGNPIYRWDEMARTGYKWWIERCKSILQLVDFVRLDHFRGFEAYWEVPAGHKTAAKGKWIKGPGEGLFNALTKSLGELPILAENLGMITPPVEALREQFGFPGMSILQFNFGGDGSAPNSLPHNYQNHLVVYTGTHDNDTMNGWWNFQEGESTQSMEAVRRERSKAAAYFNTSGRDFSWVCIRALMASVADIAIFPLQDVFGLGSEARMNMPGRPGGNWRWRYTADMLTPALRDRLAEFSTLYCRA